MAILGDHDIGLFVCTGGFTKDAQIDARSQASRRITLMDTGMLFDLWGRNYLQIPQGNRVLLPIRPVYFLDHRALD